MTSSRARWFRLCGVPLLAPPPPTRMPTTACTWSWSGRAWTRVRRLLVVALLFAAGGAGAQDSEPTPGARLLAPFKQELQQALRSGLAQGPVEAIAACQLRAPEIADARSRDGVRMGRSSHRLRNPSNAAPAWVAPVLEAYASDASDRMPRTVTLPGNRSGYIEPIALGPVCLTCHGDALAPEVAARIEQLYPDDRAVGFEVGDLRGVFWVEFPRAESE